MKSSTVKSIGIMPVPKKETPLMKQRPTDYTKPYQQANQSLTENPDEKVTAKHHPSVITQAFDELNKVGGRIIQELLREEGNEKYTVIGRVCESINWAHKAQWSHAEFVKDGKLGTQTETKGSVDHV